MGSVGGWLLDGVGLGNALILLDVSGFQGVVLTVILGSNFPVTGEFFGEFGNVLIFQGILGFCGEILVVFCVFKTVKS